VQTASAWSGNVWGGVRGEGGEGSGQG